jgi:hypothetical protein
MWHSKSILFLCILFLFILSSNAFCQSRQVAPIKGFLSVDSVKIRDTKAKVPLRPTRIDPGFVNPNRKSPNKLQTERVLLSPATEPEWVSFHFSKIRRPGEYAAQPVIGSITSNVDILISFSGFEDLTSSKSPTQSVETYYGVSIGNERVEEVEWARASDFNEHTLLIEQNRTTPTTWSLWNKVCVKPDNSAIEYSDNAVITFVMQNTIPWTDLDKQ